MSDPNDWSLDERTIRAIDQWIWLCDLGEACCREIERVGADCKRTAEGGEG
jgi:hypothetical protein